MKIADVDGVALAYEERGSGPTVLLIHGTAARLWDPVSDSLPGRVIAYDRRSFGASTNPPLADLTRHRDDAAALLDALGAAPACIVGWSIGGVIALDLAATHPESVSSLVLVEPPLHAKRRPTLRQLRAILTAQALRRLRGDARGAETFLRWALGRRSGGSDLDLVSAEWRHAMLANAAAIMREIDAGTGEHLDQPQLARVHAPVTCLLGDDSDRAFHAAAARLVRLVPQTDVSTVDGAGHLLYADRPDALVAAVQDALNRSTSVTHST
jgi:pimeloyl-ACP methyl ester carboxylesterase